MKNLVINTALMLCVFLFSANMNASKPNKLKYDSLTCLQIEGIVNNANDGTGGECIVELIALDETVDTLVLKEGKRKFRFVLSKNSYYAIRISKKGYISKLVSVNTEIITGTEGIHVFEFETNLMKEEALVKLNKDILDFPVAIIQFDYKLESFSYNKEYSAFIKRELFKVTSSNNSVKKDETPYLYTEKSFTKDKHTLLAIHK